jgi:hypothetical protein
MKNHRSDPDEPSVSEDDCVVCGSWPAADREGMRELIARLPLDGSCAECSLAFFRRLGLFREPTRH